MAEDVVRLTERLVAADSSPGASTDAVAALLAERLAALGASVARQDGTWEGVAQCNLVARFGGDAPAGLVLAGHLDTVPWQRGQRATTAPERDGRTLYGRGSCDMKGPIAAQVLAAARSAGGLRRPLVLAFSYGEEIGCYGALHLVRDRAPLGALDGAACIVGEPTGCAPVIAHKGYAVAHLTLTGLPVHSSDPWRGVDASAALGVLLTRLHALREELRAQVDPSSDLHPPCTTLNTGLVRAGVAENVVPDRAEVVLEWRPMPGADSEALRRAVQACLDAACDAVPGVEGALEWPVPLPPFHQPADSPLVRWLVERTGHQPRGVPFYTEAELYRSGLHLPAVVCGPGSITQAHRVDESIQFDELESGVELYADAIRAFCG